MPLATLSVRRAAVACAALVLLTFAGAAGAAGESAGDPNPTHRFTLSEDQSVVGTLQRVTAKYEDTLPGIGRMFNLGYDEIARANPNLDTWLPGEGANVVLPTQFILPDAPREGLVLNVAAMRLYYFAPPDADGNRELYTHPIGIGRVGWATPLGSTKITAMAKNPAWYVPDSIRQEHAEAGDPLPAVVPPGPDNPLGSHALRLAMPGYLIHGTNKPTGVGLRVSHGCIRLYPEDIASLFEMVNVGLDVHIVEQPYLVGWNGDRLMFAAHVPLEESGGDWLAALESIDDHVQAAPAGIGPVEIDWRRVARIAREGRGVAYPILAGSPAPDEWLAASPLVRTEAVANYQPPPEDADSPEG
jgi:L,D-transpeptidase ErfK/SrfK